MPIQIRPVRNFPGYHIGNDGSVWTCWRTRGNPNGGRGVVSYISSTMKGLKVVKRPDGYTKISLRKEGKSYDFLLHRLVLETFVGSCPEGMECLHIDGDKSNNAKWNLRWGTRLENVQDSIRHGTFYNATRAAAEANRGKKKSQEFCDNLSEKMTGRVFSEEHKAAIKATHWMLRLTPEERSEQARRAGVKGGRKREDGTRNIAQDDEQEQ